MKKLATCTVLFATLFLAGCATSPDRVDNSFDNFYKTTDQNTHYSDSTADQNTEYTEGAGAIAKVVVCCVIPAIVALGAAIFKDD